ncbi:MAG: ribokinase [Microbacteriaceae bacterium]
MNSRRSIVVLGSATGDLIVRQPRLPTAGETMFGVSFTTVSGGKGLNQAVAAARAGGRVGFLGAVGDDEHGDRARAVLDEAGVDTAGLVRVDAPTGTAHISVLDGGDNAIVIVPAANSAVTALDDTARGIVRPAGFLLAQFERPMPLIAEAFRFARAAGVRTVLTPAPVAEIPADLLANTDILVPNAGEACELAAEDDPVAAACALSRRVGMVVMTRGEQGAIVARDGEVMTSVAAHPVTPVDTTGAGDTFVGVLVAWLADGAELGAALAAASAAAAICVTRPGASPSIPTRDEILARLLDPA